jgi:hypothetical protein
MGEHTVDLSAECESRLQLLVAQYNLAAKATLSLDEWIALHLKELAVQREMAQKSEEIRIQAQADAEAAAAAEKARLLEAM